MTTMGKKFRPPKKKEMSRRIIASHRKLPVYKFRRGVGLAEGAGRIREVLKKKRGGPQKERLSLVRTNSHDSRTRKAAFSKMAWRPQAAKEDQKKKRWGCPGTGGFGLGDN